MRSRSCLAFAMLAACGAKSPPPVPPPPPPVPVAQPVLPDVPFALLDLDQRAQFMKDKVVPAMAPIFKQHDATRFAAFGCKTCHGALADQRHHDMPNPELARLDLADLSEYKKADVDWMRTEVQPALARLLGMAEMSQATPRGLGCTSCHTPK